MCFIVTKFGGTREDAWKRFTFLGSEVGKHSVHLQIIYVDARFMIEKLLTFQDIELISLIITAVLFLIQILFYRVCYARPCRRLRRQEKEETQEAPKQPPVSVIVYAKNESENLKRFLPSILTQDYPKYEVIVINDGSTDESDDVLKLFEQEYKHLYHTYIPMDAKYLSRKKLALTVGIKAANNDILLFTEANCTPLSNRWIASMASQYTKETEIVLGFCAYKRGKGFFHKLAAYDNLIIGLQYITSALRHRPFIGNGGNLSYRKSLFFNHKGYYKTLELLAGEDDLFVNETGNKENTVTTYTPDSITQMSPIERYKIWMEMKVSRASTRKYYRGYSFALFRLESLTRFLFLLSVIASIVAGCFLNWMTAALAGLFIVLRLLVVQITLHKSSRMLQQRTVTAWIPLLEIIMPVYNLYIAIYRLFRGKNDYSFHIGR